MYDGAGESGLWSKCDNFCRLLPSQYIKGNTFLWYIFPCYNNKGAQRSYIVILEAGSDYNYTAWDMFNICHL